MVSGTGAGTLPPGLEDGPTHYLRTISLAQHTRRNSSCGLTENSVCLWLWFACYGEGWLHPWQLSSIRDSHRNPAKKFLKRYKKNPTIQKFKKKIAKHSKTFPTNVLQPRQ